MMEYLEGRMEGKVGRGGGSEMGRSRWKLPGKRVEARGEPEGRGEEGGMGARRGWVR